MNIAGIIYGSMIRDRAEIPVEIFFFEVGRFCARFFLILGSDISRFFMSFYCELEVFFCVEAHWGANWGDLKKKIIFTACLTHAMF